MTERSALVEGTQIGVETTPGTAVAATRKLGAMTLRPKVGPGSSFFRPSGFKVPTSSTPLLDMTTAAMSGKPCYDELIYPFSSLLGAETPTQQGGTDAYLWEWASNDTAEIAPKTYTVEIGQSARALEFSYGIFNSLQLTFPNSREPSMSGEVIGQEATDGITMTSSIDAPALVPIDGNDVCWFLDDSAAALGTTKLTRVLNSQVNFPARYSTLPTVDCAEPSWAAVIEQQAEPVITLTLAADSVGMARLADLRNNTRRFLQCVATGPLADTGYDFSLTMGFAVEVDSLPQMTDQNGVIAQAVVFRCVYDETWAQSFNVALINLETGL